MENATTVKTNPNKNQKTCQVHDKQENQKKNCICTTGILNWILSLLPRRDGILEPCKVIHYLMQKKLITIVDVSTKYTRMLIDNLELRLARKIARRKELFAAIENNVSSNPTRGYSNDY